jgi:hypothetical protein
MLASVLAVLLLDRTVGTPVPLPFALGLAALLGAWPLPLYRGLTQPVAIALPLLALTGLIGFGAGLGGRWVCPAGNGEYLRFLTQDPGASDVAVIPGNLPFILLLRGDAPARLERLSPTGVISESVALERPGGRLVSSGTSGGQVARLVPAGSEGEAYAQVEWWNPSTMERVALIELPPSCAPEGGRMDEDSPAIALSCSDGRLLRLDPKNGSWSDIGDPSPGSRANYSSDSLPLRLRGGPLARFVIETSTEGSAPALGPFSAGPWTNRARVTPGGLVLARGPLGQVEVRGEDPLWTLGVGAPESSGADRKADEARHVLNRARIPGWPDRMLWSPHHAALWVTSRNSGDISLVDTQVTWHRKTVQVGPPPRAAVVDAGSGTLFGVNRCGLFTLRIPSIFPWESTGDVEGAALDPPPEASSP